MPPDLAFLMFRTLRTLRTLIATLLLWGCASQGPVIDPGEAARLEDARRVWQARVAALGTLSPLTAPLIDRDDPVAVEVDTRLAAAPCRLVIDQEYGLLRLGPAAVFIPSLGLIEALDQGRFRREHLRQMPSRDGILVGLDLDDARATLWHVPCAAPHTVTRKLTLKHADFARAVLDLRAEVVVVPRDGLLHLPLDGERPQALRLIGPPCGTSGAAFSPELWTADGIVGRCEDSRRVLAPTRTGWQSVPYVEVSGLARDDGVIWLGLGRGTDSDITRGVVWRSEDEGQTFAAIPLLEGSPTGEEVVVSRRFVAARSGREVFVSTNRKTFARARTPFPETTVERLWVSDKNTLLAGHRVLDGSGPVRWKVVESKDLGRNWKGIEGLPPPTRLALTLPDGSTFEPGPRGLWKRRLHGSRQLVFPAAGR